MKKRAIKDVLINLFTTFILLFAIQILFYPEISKSFDSTFFGKFIYVISIINLIGSLIGGAIGNVYLKNYSVWKEENVLLNKFSVLIIISIMLYIGSIFLFIILNFLEIIQGPFSIVEIILVFLIILFNQMRIIFTVWLRSTLDYKNILFLNCLMAVAYIIGWSLLKLNMNINVLLIVFAAEIIFSIVFLNMNIKSFKIKNIKSLVIDRPIINSVALLLISSMFYTLYKYIDRFLIGNFLDLSFVSVFYVANITGLIFSMPFNVLSNVIFSYIAQRNKMVLEQMKLLVIYPVLFSLTVYYVSLYFGPMLIRLLYNEYYDSAMEIFKIINLGNSLLLIDYLLRGFIIKHYSEMYKLISDVVALGIFLFISFAFVNINPLHAIAYGYTGGIIFKCLFSYFLLIKFYIKMTKNKISI